MISKMEKKNANPSYNLILKIVEFLEKYESPKEKTKKAPRAVLKTKVFTPLPFSQRDMNQYYQFKSAQRKIKRQEQDLNLRQLALTGSQGQRLRPLGHLGFFEYKSESIPLLLWQKPFF